MVEVKVFLDRIEAWLDRFHRPPMLGDEPIRAGILAMLLWTVASACIGYGILAAMGIKSRFFPWDLIEVVAVVLVCARMLFKGRVHLASVLLLVVLSHPLAFIIGTYGVGGFAPAILLPSIVICGLLVGRRLVPTWTAICCALLLWCAFPRNELTRAMAPALTFWIVSYALTGWLVLLFAYYMEELLRAVLHAEVAQRAAIVAERTRMARDLHDSLAQGFTGVIVQLNAAEQAGQTRPDQLASHLTKAREVAQEGLVQARASVLALREMGSIDLAESLRETCENALGNSGIVFFVKATGKIDEVSASGSDVLLGVTREALTNILRHADARTVAIAVERIGKHVRLTIEDDGVGFEPSNLGGLGLKGMQERVVEVGGSLSISSQPGAGTTIVCEVSV